MSESSVSREPARRRFRRFATLLLLVPLVELILLIVVSSHVGATKVLLVVAASALLGSVLVRRGTPRAWATLRELAGRGPTPSHHLSRDARTADGHIVSGPAGTDPEANLASVGTDLTEDLLFLVAGLFLLWPGLITTAAGLVLLIPPVRRALARRLGRSAARATTARVERFVETSRSQLQGGVIRVETVDRGTFRRDDSGADNPGHGPTRPQLEQ